MSKQILVVDDSATMRQQLRMVLEGEGFKVSEADDGDKGAELAKNNPVDLIIADVNMPRVDGLQMIAKIRECPEHQKTPIFVLTTEATPAMKARGKQVGATAWVVKPFSSNTLIKAISRVLLS